MAKIKVGIIGTGDRGTSFVKVIQNEIPELEVVAVADTNFVRLESVPKLHEYPPCEKFTSVDDLLNSNIADVIMVSTSVCTHAEVLVKCMEKGYHVFCDKPLAINPQQTKQILEAARKTKKMQFMGFNMRYNSQFIKMHQIIEDGEIGSVLSGTA